MVTRRQPLLTSRRKGRGKKSRSFRPLLVVVTSLIAACLCVLSATMPTQQRSLRSTSITAMGFDCMTTMKRTISVGHHVNVPPPSSRLGPNGEQGYVHNPRFAIENPRPLQPSVAVCTVPGQGFERTEGYQSLQNIRHHLETSTAPRNVSVLCAIYTHAGGVNNTEAVRETWGQRCDGLLFASSTSDINTGHTHMPSYSTHGFGYKSIHQRVRTMMAYLYDNFLNSGYDYFHFSGDDTYLIVEHLKEFLASRRVQDWEKSPGQYVVAGFWMHWNAFLVHMKEGEVYPSGGPGYTISRKALKAYVEGPLQTCSKRDYDGAAEDQQFGFCLRETLMPPPQSMLDTRDEVGAHRYHPENAFWHATYGYPNYNGGMTGMVMQQTMEHMNRQYGYPIVSKEAFVSNSSIAFHRHNADDLRRYEVLLYGDRGQLCGDKVKESQ